MGNGHHTSRYQLAFWSWGVGGVALDALFGLENADLREAAFLHSRAALQARLGDACGEAVSEATARALAVSAFHRAGVLGDVAPSAIVAIGVVVPGNAPDEASMPPRVHCGWHRLDRTVAVTCTIDQPDEHREPVRLVQEILVAIANEACGGESPLQTTSRGIAIQRQETVAPDEWRELIIGLREYVALGGADSPSVLLPGAFNPLHLGHTRMAELATQKLDRPVTFELALTNVDKPPLDYLEIERRLALLAGKPVVLTRSPTFVEKARLFPGCTFVVGIDTIERIGQVRFYGHDPQVRNKAIAYLAERGCRFLVFGRTDGARFRGLDDIELPPALRELCDPVPEHEFRQDVSSTDIRGGNRAR